MRILHLTTFVQGSAGYAVTELATQQRIAGNDVVVLTSRTGVPPYGNSAEHLRTLEDAGVNLFAIDSLFRRDQAANLNVVSFIQQRLGPAPFDVIHAHAPVAGLVAIIAASGTPARVIQTVHRWGDRKSAAQTQSDVAVLRQQPRVVVRDDAAGPMLIRLGVAAERIGVVPYGVHPNQDPFDGLDVTDADIRLVRNMRSHGRPVICCIGTVGPSGNQRLLVDALTAIPAAVRPFCIVVGAGDVGRLTLYARTRGVESAIRFCGYKPNARRFLREADVFVRPGADEGLSLSAIEAFCDRVPVVAAANADVRKVMQGVAAGTLFAPGDAAGLASAIRATLGMSVEARDAMRRAAHEIYRARFTAAAMSERYAAEYRRLPVAPRARAGEELAAA